MHHVLHAVCIAILATFASFAEAQTFSLPAAQPPTNAGQLPATSNDLYFTMAPPPKPLSFSYAPPARRMFADLTGDMSFYPALFPSGVHFSLLTGAAPAFFSDRFKGAFTAYRVGNYYLALQVGYTLHSATIRNGRLFVLAKDSTGAFVVLSPAHIAVAQADGTPAGVNEVTSQPAILALLVDRSASITGFDAEIGAALATVSATLAPTDRCAIYEFGSYVRALQQPGGDVCSTVFAGYHMAAAGGSTPLYEAMGQAYSDLASEDTIAAVVIISDGAPSDSPDDGLAAAAARTPTFVLWVGNHTENYIGQYSTSHAVSREGARDEVEDFLRAVSVSVRGHQTFAISNN